MCISCDFVCIQINHRLIVQNIYLEFVLVKYSKNPVHKIFLLKEIFVGVFRSKR
jgi:diadenosine tetraphosphate (Ap4A) HIT family hydrolase